MEGRAISSDALSPEPNSIRAYLLGLLTDGEREALEDRFFGDSELLDRIDRAEQDLIQDYMAHRLSPVERSAFESHFLRSTAARRKVEESRTVAEYFRRSSQRRVAPLLVLAVSLLLLAAVSGYLAIDLRRTRAELAASEAAPRMVAAAVAEFEIMPGRSRSGGAEQLFRLEAGRSLLRLNLKMDSAPCARDICRAELLEPGGPVLVSLPVLLDNRGLYVEVPASALPDHADLLLDVRNGRQKIESIQFGLKKISLSQPKR